MAKDEKQAPAETPVESVKAADTPAVVDMTEGMGGCYAIDPTTGKRIKVAPPQDA